ncbi:MAG: hypothetical protein GY834_02285 [Bacteroidetes bacterium]|nr:hypothetical protein [Bacteroidota bacterium]
MTDSRADLAFTMKLSEMWHEFGNLMRNEIFHRNFGNYTLCYIKDCKRCDELKERETRVSRRGEK